MRTIIAILFGLLFTVAQAAEEVQRFDIDFDGGNAREFVEAIDNLEINLIIPGDADAIQIPTVKLRNITAAKLFQALTIIGTQSPTKFAFERSGGPYTTVLNHDGTFITDTQDQIWVLQNLSAQRTAQPFAIGHLLQSESNEQGYTIDDITSAIDSTVQAYASVAERGSDIAFQYHEGTELLIITGSVPDVTIARSTLNTLRESLRSKTWGGNFGNLIENYTQQRYGYTDNQ